MTIYEVLSARYADQGLTAEIGLRQESGLNPAQISESDVAAMDRYVKRRINSRADTLTGILQVAAGRWFWPFSEQHLALAYPNQDAAQRANTARIIGETAADAVAAGVLGDLFNRASSRDDKYREQRDYYVGDPRDKSDTGEAGRLANAAKSMVASALQFGDATDDARVATLGTLQFTTPPDALATEWTPERCENLSREPWEGTR